MKKSLELLRDLPRGERYGPTVREVLDIFQAADCGCRIYTVHIFYAGAMGPGFKL